MRTEWENYAGHRLVARSRTDFLQFDYLPATPVNVALTTVVGAHPGVPIRDPKSLRPAQIPGYVENAG